MVAKQRQLIVEDTDGSPSQKSDDEDEDDGKEPSARDLRMASIDAIAKFTDYSKCIIFGLLPFVLNVVQ